MVSDSPTSQPTLYIKVFNLTTDKTDNFQPETTKDCLKTAVRDMEKGKSTGYSTDIPDLDKLIGKLTKQELIIIARRASMGKMEINVVQYSKFIIK